MVRLRGSLQAVPSRVWSAVAGLAVLASMSVAVVLGAGLQVWRGAVGTGTPGAPPPTALAPLPSSGLVTVPSGTPTPHAAARPRHPARPAGRPAAPVVSPTAVPGPATAEAPTPAASAAPPARAEHAPVVPVVALDALLDALHGPGHHHAVEGLASLALDPTLHAWSVGGTVEGAGTDDLLRIVRAHASRGDYRQVLAAMRRAGHAHRSPGPSAHPSTPAPRRGRH